MNGSKKIQAGAVVFWSIPQGTNRETLLDVLTQVGLADYTPEPRTPMAALKTALESVFTDVTTIVRPLRNRNGWAVVDEMRGDAKNDYAINNIALFDAEGRLKVFANGKMDAVRATFDEERTRLHSSQVGHCLARIVMERLGGIRLRPQGSVYWLPAARITEWETARAAIEVACPGACLWTIEHDWNPESVKAIRDNLLTEIKASVSGLMDSVTNEPLGKRAAKNRQERAEALRLKIAEYEDHLQVGLTELTELVSRAEVAVVAAMMVANASPDEVPA